MVFLQSKVIMKGSRLPKTQLKQKSMSNLWPVKGSRSLEKSGKVEFLKEYLSEKQNGYLQRSRVTGNPHNLIV